jgi:hypothetical protein
MTIWSSKIILTSFKNDQNRIEFTYIPSNRIKGNNGSNSVKNQRMDLFEKHLLNDSRQLNHQVKISLISFDFQYFYQI